MQIAFKLSPGMDHEIDVSKAPGKVYTAQTMDEFLFHSNVDAIYLPPIMASETLGTRPQSTYQVIRPAMTKSKGKAGFPEFIITGGLKESERGSEEQEAVTLIHKAITAAQEFNRSATDPIRSIGIDLAFIGSKNLAIGRVFEMLGKTRGVPQKINSNQELYQTVREIAEKLKAHGEMNWYTRLQNALSISTVTGEILGNIKMELSALEEKRIARKLGLLDIINDALLYLVQVYR